MTRMGSHERYSTERATRRRDADSDPLHDARGPGAEGYFLSRDMAVELEMDDRRRTRGADDESAFPRLGG